MNMTGERQLSATRLQVWHGLNDPSILRGCIPGCSSLEPAGVDSYHATASVKIGPLSANFIGNVALLDIKAPSSYRIEGSGQGGAAGFAKGGATVVLEEHGEATILRYTVKAEVGGKIAQLGSRLVDASAKQMADQFFDRFATAIVAAGPIAADGPAALAASIPTAARMPFRIPAKALGFPLRAWAAAAVFLFIVFNLFAT